MRRVRLALRCVAGALVALWLAGCGLALRSDRAEVGGGPEQATAQAQARSASTVQALATAYVARVDDKPCTCDSE